MGHFQGGDSIRRWPCALRLGLERASVNELAFERGEEALGHRGGLNRRRRAKRKGGPQYAHRDRQFADGFGPPSRRRHIFRLDCVAALRSLAGNSSPGGSSRRQEREVRFRSGGARTVGHSQDRSIRSVCRGLHPASVRTVSPLTIPAARPSQRRAGGPRPRRSGRRCGRRGW